MLIDCDSCEMRSIACDDCMVTALLGGAPGNGDLDIDDRESAALGVLAESGLVPPLRLVVPDAGGQRATGTG
ncbi:MAG: hypothetical protein J2P24_15215 [Streptosporangiales bacterium]|nr:hypothetical protein [Streptosporangiales bacterium]MBO0890667.1 hypothetical protein [Acidothermales bacterium]